MSGYGSLAPYGLLEYSDEDNPAEQIYDQMRSAAGALVVDDTIGEALIHAKALCLGLAVAELRRIGKQVDPAFIAPELIAIRELQVGIVASPYATMTERRAAVAIKENVSKGGAYSNIVSQLQLALGSDFIAYRPIKKEESTAIPEDPDETTGNWLDPRTARAGKLFQTVSPITTMGSPVWVEYTTVDGALTYDNFVIGETIVVDPGDETRCEVVAISDIDDTTDPPKIEAEFRNTHAAGALLSNQYFPAQSCDKRHSLIVVTAAAAANGALRNRVDEVMRGVARGVSTWTIVPGESDAESGTLGPFRVNQGRLGITPIGSIDYP